MYRISFHDEGETRWTMDDDEYTLDTAETSQIAYHRRCLMKLSETSRLCYAVLMSTFETVRKYYVDEVNLMGFCHPVDDRDYRKYIKTPIDLRVVYDKIMVSAYDTERAFLSDVQTVWSNCLTYCQGRYDNVVVEMQTLSKIFEGEYEKVFNNDGSSSKNTKSKAPYDEWFGFPPWVRSFENGLCWVCNCAASKSNPVIICEECDGEFHLHCVKPRLKKVPKNDFICVYSKKNDAYTSLAKRSKLSTKKVNLSDDMQEEAARSQRYIGKQITRNIAGMPEPLMGRIDSLEQNGLYNLIYEPTNAIEQVSWEELYVILKQMEEDVNGRYIAMEDRKDKDRPPVEEEEDAEDIADDSGVEMELEEVIETSTTTTTTTTTTATAANGVEKKFTHVGRPIMLANGALAVVLKKKGNQVTVLGKDQLEITLSMGNFQEALKKVDDIQSPFLFRGTPADAPKGNNVDADNFMESEELKPKLSGHLCFARHTKTAPMWPGELLKQPQKPKKPKRSSRNRKKEEDAEEEEEEE